MKYIKAREILPEHLIDEIQKYIQGQMLYIPSTPGTRKPWGEKSGARTERIQRNMEIRDSYKKGYSMEALSEKYCLSVETIKKIVYSR